MGLMIVDFGMGAHSNYARFDCRQGVKASATSLGQIASNEIHGGYASPLPK